MLPSRTSTAAPIRAILIFFLATIIFQRFSGLAVKFFPFFEVKQGAAADQKRGDDAGQRLTGGCIAVGVVGIDLEHIILMGAIGTEVAAGDRDIKVKLYNI